MKEIIQHYNRYLIASLLLHGTLLTFLLCNVETGISPKQNSAASLQPEIIQAVAIDEAKVVAEINRIQTEENQQKIAKELQQKELVQKIEQIKREREAEQAKLEKLKKDMAQAKLEEQNRLAELRLVKENEKKQLEALKQAKEKEKKKLAALDDELKAEKDRFKEMQSVREQEEKKRLEGVKQQQEARRKAEEGKRLMALKAAREGAERAAARQSQLAGEIQKVVNAWGDKIRANRREALGMPSDLYCKLGITVLPDGHVRVTLLKSSGNALYDDLSMKAVYKAQPFQLPEDPLVREQVKSFEVGMRNDEEVG